MTTRSTKNWVVNLIITTVLAALMAIGGTVWFFRALGRPGDTASIDCDRTRNDCVFAHGQWHRTIPLPELKQARLESLPLIRPDRRGQYVEVTCAAARASSSVEGPSVVAAAKPRLAQSSS